MRAALTLFAVALVALLTAALIAPLLIDWSAHRAGIEARLGAITGGRVELKGPITLRLLPIPYIELGEGAAAGSKPDAPKLSFQSARLELALARLASGAIRFSEIRLEKPVLTLTRGADGTLDLPEPPAREAGAVGFDAFSVRDGVIRIRADDGASERTIGGVDIDAQAPSLAGPYRVAGRAAGPGGAPIVFRLASETAKAAGLPIHIAVEAGPGWPELDFDGSLILGAGEAKRPSLSGSATLTGVSSGPDGKIPWLVVGSLAADLDQAKLANAAFRLGQEERAVRADGDLTLRYGASSPRLVVRAKAKQANLDGLLRRKGEDGAPPKRVLAVASAALGPAFAAPGGLTVEADLSAHDVILGSDSIPDVSVSLIAAPAAPLRMRFDAGLPGRSRLRADGELQTGSAPRFRGAVDFSADNLSVLRAWASKGAPAFAARAAALSDAFDIRSAALSGEVEGSSTGFSGRGLTLALEHSTLAGTLAYSSPAGARPGRLAMDLTSDSLDLASLPSLTMSAGLLGDLDFSLALRAKSLHVSHLGEGAIDSGSLSLQLEKSGPTTTLDRLTVEDLGGASLDAHGAIGPDGAIAAGRLDAAKLGDFALLMSRLAPGPWSKILVERAPVLSPTSVDFELHGDPPFGGDMTRFSLKANGTIGRTRAVVAVEPLANGDGQTIALDLDAPDSGALLRQLGLPGRADPAGTAHVGLHAAGAWQAGYDIEANGAFEGVDVSAKGRFAPTAEGDEARLFGSASFKSANAAPLVAALGLAPPGGAIGPVDMHLEATQRGARWTVSRLSATIAGFKASGKLAYETPAKPVIAAPANPDVALAEEAVNGPAGAAEAPSQPALTGELSFDRLPLPGLLALALGPPQPAKAGALWSEARFAPIPLLPPPVAVRVSAPVLEGPNGFLARDFSATVRLDQGRLDLGDMKMMVAGGTASGALTVRRSRDGATLSGILNAERLVIGGAGLSGRVGGTLQFASTGKSMAALIAGLAGGGQARLAGVELKRADAGALDRVVAKAQAPDAQIDETNIAYDLGRELDKATLKPSDGAAPLSLSAGTVKLGPISIARPAGEATLGASLDLTKLTLETRLGLTAPAAGLAFWTGAPPTATVTVENALSAPRRILDVASLSAALATQAIARETDRIASLDADIRERAFFNRRLKGERFMDRREQELEDWRAEQARLKGIAERAATERAEAEKAAAPKKPAAGHAPPEPSRPFPQPELPPDLPSGPPLQAKPAEVGLGAAPRAAFPTPPTRPKTHPAPERGPSAEPMPGSLY